MIFSSLQFHHPGGHVGKPIFSRNLFTANLPKSFKSTAERTLPSYFTTIAAALNSTPRNWRNIALEFWRTPTHWRDTAWWWGLANRRLWKMELFDCEGLQRGFQVHQCERPGQEIKNSYWVCGWEATCRELRDWLDDLEEACPLLRITQIYLWAWVDEPKGPCVMQQSWGGL